MDKKKLSTPVYKIENLRHFHGKESALGVDDLEIQQASIVGLVGPNGSGKSTLLRLLGFIEKPSRGSIRYSGQPAYPFSEAVRFHVTLLPQEPYLLKRTVFSNVAYGLKIRGDATTLQKQKVSQALSWVGLPVDKFAQRPWSALSGGEAQRVALAARLVLKPRVLLLDEPTASIDAESAHLIKAAALRARDQWGTTLVIASHDWQWLRETSDRVLHLYNGRVLGTGLQNILTGPWEKLPQRWERDFSDGQSIVFSAPSNHAEAAIINPGAIRICMSPPRAGFEGSALRGRLARITAEKHSRDLVATVLVDSVSFTAKLPEAQMRSEQIIPGREVWLQFDEAAVEWV
jgi:tungstate transport system ATP-binding protein